MAATEITGPDSDFPGLDIRWSRHLMVPDATGTKRRWHCLDNAATLQTEPVGTIFAVHGNPTWSYLWRDLLAQAASLDQPWRVVAVDQLEMGYSERTGRFRRLQERIDDLGRFTDVAGIDGPVVSIGHDWGGALSLGWAAAHREQLVASVVTNTAIDQPTGTGLPFLIWLASLPGLHWPATVGTPTFLHSTMATGQPIPPKDVRRAYLAPYRTRERRKGIGEFVADIPTKPNDPSMDDRGRLTQAVRSKLADVPVLLLWGPRDPVFGERYLRNLQEHLPHATTHRFEKAGHMVVEEADVAGAALAWLADNRIGVDAPAPPQDPRAAIAAASAPQIPEARRPLWGALEERAEDDEPAIIEMLDNGGRKSISWSELAGKVNAVAAGLTESGVKPGDRVALLVTPGPDLTVAMYACLRIGAVIVVVDAGLGVVGMHRALKAANPKYLFGIDRALVPARLLGWAPNRISSGLHGNKGQLITALSGAERSLEQLARLGQGKPLPPEPDPDQEAVVVFTSGSTGPAKGVAYRFRQTEAAKDALNEAYQIRPDDCLVAAFAPFALFGPALGVTSVVPAMDVTAPRTLTASALASAAGAADATVVFASPAALANVVKTADRVGAGGREALYGIRLLLSAGAPVSVPMLNEILDLMPNAEPHTPYGMTESLPVTDVTFDELVEAGPGNGVLVGRPIAAATVAIAPLDGQGAATGDPTTEPGVTGEILIRADHGKDRYDQLWWTERNSRHPAGFHRSGDIGHLDAEGKLWVEGRLAHAITSAEGVLTPVGIEQRIETIDGVFRAAVVGVGPTGTQQVVVVVETEPEARRQGLASVELTAQVRATVDVPVAAVFAVPSLPTDIRHNAKIKRAKVAAWAERMLAGKRGGRW